jgi:hypothetical protein
MPISLESSVPVNDEPRRRWRVTTERESERRERVGASAAVAVAAAEPEDGDAGESWRASETPDGTTGVATEPVGVLRLDLVLPGLEDYDLFAVRRRTARAPTRPADAHLHPVRVGAIEIDARTQIVRRNGAIVALPPKCFAVLSVLARARGRAMSRTELLRAVWSDSWVQARTVDTAIWHLRKCLEDDPMHPRCIVTVKKHGYRLADPAEG